MFKCFYNKGRIYKVFADLSFGESNTDEHWWLFLKADFRSSTMNLLKLHYFQVSKIKVLTINHFYLQDVMSRIGHKVRRNHTNIENNTLTDKTSCMDKSKP